MPNFRTCHTCARPGATCETRATLQASIAGLSIVSLKHRCRDYAPAFLPGEAVKVETFAWFRQGDGYDEGPAPKLWFPGHFIRLAGQRALVFVRKGAVSITGDDVEFEPGGKGYLKVPMARVAHRDAEPVDVTACRWCAAIPGLDGNCGRDPNYTPRGDCLAAKSTGQEVTTPTDGALGRQALSVQADPISSTKPTDTQTAGGEET